ncbi:efflux RND transporter periplasmic adaptor subunit [Shewanella halifaxensis]|uniref:efflux RND transporter periplasmic adaptor subunit n=1 Tax=Shewanella halifaxensis TaxID=271098 RepID=UPI0013A67EAE|nr:efflux RND transporter periplasmic adaptor subunit [Shewanella halifaxensis]
MTKVNSLLVAMTASILITGCQPAPEVLTSEPIIRPVLIEQVSMAGVADLAFNGTIYSANRADLSFRTNGRLVEMLVQEGDHLVKNQLIAKLDSVDAEITLTSAISELKNARAEYQRGKTLFENQQSISKSQFEELTLRFNLAQNKLTEAEARLNDTKLYAPFSGVVSRAYVDNHVLVQGNEPIISIHDLSNLEAVIPVPESMMIRNSEDKVQIYAQSALAPNEKFNLTLKKYETEPDPVTGTYAVTFSVEASEKIRLLPGMNVSVFSDTAELASKIVQVPLTAVTPDNLGNQYVWIVDDANTLHKRNVVIGSLNGEYAQVTSNLHQSERVVVSGTKNLQEGLIVRPELTGNN